jgi:nitroreductase
MDVLECIETRTSIRRYSPVGPMPEADVKKILTAGFEAPSAMNRRPYELIINTDNSFWSKFEEAKPNSSFVKDASLTVLVVGDLSKNPSIEFLLEDCSLVAENMLLAATALGYGSLWLGVKFKTPFASKLNSYFHLPKGFVPVAFLVFGVPAEKSYHDNRYDESKIHYGKF